MEVFDFLGFGPIRPGNMVFKAQTAFSRNVKMSVYLVAGAIESDSFKGKLLLTNRRDVVDRVRFEKKAVPILYPNQCLLLTDQQVVEVTRLLAKQWDAQMEYVSTELWNSVRELNAEL